jgi:membrane protein implicated in regulation of membrane protease activity
VAEPGWATGATPWVALRYALFQIPELGLVAVGLYFAHNVGWLTPLGAGLVFAAWLIKDAVLFPFVRNAYAPQDGRLPRDPRGQVGIAPEGLEVEGYVRLGPERWQARRATGSARIAPGESVRVVSLEGLTLVVEACGDGLPESAIAEGGS